MTALTDQESSWVGAVANRLRLIQTDATTAAPDKRREFLQEELARSLRQVPAANRQRLLEAILAVFPVRGQILTPAPAPVTPTPVTQPVEEEPEDILERLLTAAAGLSKERRAALIMRLTERGLATQSPSAAVPELAPEVRELLALPADQQPQMPRLVELVGLLVELFQRLHQNALATLRELSPQNPLSRRPQDFRNIVGLFLTSEDESVEPLLRQSGGLPAVMLAAIRGDERKRSAAAQFVRRYEERFSPRAIEEVVEAEKRFGFLKLSKKETCWEKYVELSTDFANPVLMERWIKDCLGRVVDDYLKELDRTQASGGR